MSVVGKCHRCATDLEDGDLRCSICGTIAPALDRVVGEVQRIVRCDECGAAVAHRAEEARRAAFAARRPRSRRPKIQWKPPS